jgi:hypothetical protein
MKIALFVIVLNGDAGTTSKETYGLVRAKEPSQRQSTHCHILTQFQPMLSTVNEDRAVTENWDIGGQTWLFLTVCDGQF